MGTGNLSLLIENILEAMSALQLCESTVLSYRRSAFPPIKKYHKKMGTSEYSEALTAEFIKRQQERLQEGVISARHFRKIRKAANLLHEFHTYGNLVWKIDTKENLPNNPYYKQVCVSFLSSLNGSIADGTINGVKSTIVNFLSYLEDIGHTNFQKVSPTDVQSFLIKVSEKNSRSMGNTLFALRKFWKHLVETGDTSFDAAAVLQKPAGPYKKVLPCFTKNEAQALLSQVQDGSA